MDEPFAAVDMQTRELLQDELLQIWNTTDTTVVFVTHSIEEAIYLGDRVVVMGAQPGRVRADVPIDLPRPRYETDVKASAHFGELRGLIREALRGTQAAAVA
jgi:NitT/TauT family transport system ATP-binding protein